MNCHLIILLIWVSISKLTHAQFTTSDIVNRCLRYHICLRSSFNQYSSEFQNSLHSTHLCNYRGSIVLKMLLFDLDIFVKFAMRLIQNWQWYTCLQPLVQLQRTVIMGRIYNHIFVQSIASCILSFLSIGGGYEDRNLACEMLIAIDEPLYRTVYKENTTKTTDMAEEYIHRINKIYKR